MMTVRNQNRFPGTVVMFPSLEVLRTKLNKPLLDILKV